MSKDQGFYLDAKWTATILMMIIAIVYWISPLDLFTQSPIDDGVVIVAVLVVWIVLVLIPHEPKKKKQEGVKENVGKRTRKRKHQSNNEDLD